MECETSSGVLDEYIFEEVLLDTLPNPVYYKDTQGKFIRCNKAFSKLVDCNKEYIMGKVAYDFFPKLIADRHKLIDKEIMSNLGRFADEIIFPMTNGENKIFILNKAVYLNKDGTIGGIVCVMNDLTQSIKQKNLLIQQSKFAEMGEMIASIAHQWNEPLVELSALIQRLQLFHTMGKVDENHMQEFVNNTMKQVKYMSETLHDFRSFLSPSKQKESFCIKDAISDILDIVGKQIFYFNISINQNFENGDDLKFYGFKNELKQVLLNIINNAKNKIIKINETNNKLKGVIDISVKSSKKYNLIEIKDNGGAIETSVIEHIFEPFFTTKIDGMGFGLYMSKMIIEDKMNGKLSVCNDNENVIFTIKIPKKEFDLKENF